MPSLWRASSRATVRRAREGHRTRASTRRRTGDRAPRSAWAQGADRPEPEPCRPSGGTRLLVLYCSRDCRRSSGGGYPPPKPLSAKRIPANIRSLCRSYTGEAVRSLAAIMRNADAPPRARLQAIDILLDRGWGKPAQTPKTHTGEDRDVRVTVRTEGKP